MRAQGFARLLLLGSLALSAPSPAAAQTGPFPGIAFDRELGPGWFSVIAPLPDGGFVVAGRRFAQESGEQHPFVVRLAPDGKVRWERAFPDRSGGEAQAVQVLPGSGVRLTGFAGRSYDKPTVRRLDWIAEIDDDGRVSRNDGLDLDRPDHEGRFFPVTASRFAFYGSAYLQTGTPGIDIFTTDIQGTILWRAKAPDVAGDCEGMAMADPDGNLVSVAGTAEPDLTRTGPRFRRFDARGQIVHDRSFSAYADACPMAVSLMAGTGFLVTGSRSDDAGPSGWVALLDKDGALVWERLFGPAEKAVSVAYQAAPAPDGSVVVAGCIDGATSEGVVLRYDRTGGKTAELKLVSESGINPTAVQVSTDGSIVLAGVLDRRCGWISGNTNGGRAWVSALPPKGLDPIGR